VKKRLKRKLCN